MRPELRALEFERAAGQIELLRAEKSLDKPTVTAIWSAGLDSSWRHRPKALQCDRSQHQHPDLRRPSIQGPCRRSELQGAGVGPAAGRRGKSRHPGCASGQAQRRHDLSTDRLDRGTTASRPEALDLAQERYRLGLSSIVELNQTLLSVTDAEIANASAKFEFLVQRSVLDYHSGLLH